MNEHYHHNTSLTAIIISGILLLAGILLNPILQGTHFEFVGYIIFIIAYLFAGGRVILAAAVNIFRGKIFHEFFLMGIATLGAIAIQLPLEAVSIMLFFSIGEYLQDLAVGKSKKAIESLVDVRPDIANLKTDEGIQTVHPDCINVGDVIIIKPGERVPLDGKVIYGSSFLDTSMLTGESVPRKASPEDTILAGMINQDGIIEVYVEKESRESSIARIMHLVEHAATRKASTEQFITKFSRYYTPVITLAAIGVATLPLLLIPGAVFTEWAYRALVLLVISCPCALVISIPLGYFGGIGSASRHGILVKGANFLDALTSLHTVVVDKTGTLTEGVFEVVEIGAYGDFTEDKILEIAASAEQYSHHPIAKSILEAYDDTPLTVDIQKFQEIPGRGIKAELNGEEIIIGNREMMNLEGIPHEPGNLKGTVVYVAVDKIFAGYIIIADRIKQDAQTAIQELKALGIKTTVMLTGDNSTVAENVRSETQIDIAFANLLPEDKVVKVEELSRALPEYGKNRLAFVGDGINDAPVIMRADVGIAMGALGSDAAVEAADVVIMDDKPSKLGTAIQIARYTKRIVIQNIIFALMVKGVFIITGILGAATMWGAVFADVGVTLLAVLNSMRIIRKRYSFPKNN
ncbi:MAG: cadmium-translocating P-type ATPase [Firmicutes bacterium]|nr:cadmium-translocating P-type ATPase [Bacillota bacterium]